MCNSIHRKRVWGTEEGNWRFRSAGWGRWTNALGAGFLDHFTGALNWCFLMKKKKKRKIQPFRSSAPDLHNTFKWRHFHRAHLIPGNTLELEQRGFASVKRTEKRRQQGLASVSLEEGQAQGRGCLTLTRVAQRLEDRTKSIFVWQAHLPSVPPCLAGKSELQSPIVRG